MEDLQAEEGKSIEIHAIETEVLSIIESNVSVLATVVIATVEIGNDLDEDEDELRERERTREVTWETRRASAYPPSWSDSGEDPPVGRGRTERSRSTRGSWQKFWVWVPEGSLSPVTDEDPAREQRSRSGELDEEVEVEGESVDTETGEPRTRLAEPVEAAPEVPAGSPEVGSAVDFSAATEPATEERSASVDDSRERARKLRSKQARPTASKPSPSVSEQEEKPVEERVKPPPKATGAKARTKKGPSEPAGIEREQSSRQREGEGSSGSGLQRDLEALPVPPPVPTKEEVEQAETARKLELERLPTPPPAPRVPPVAAPTRSTSKPHLTEKIQPVVLAPRPKERPPQAEQAGPSTSARRAEPRGDPPVWQDKPLVLLDFHKTLSFPNNDPPIAEATVQTLKGLKDKGFAVGVLSFASNKATQESVAAGVADLEHRLGWSLDVFAITRTKFSTPTLNRELRLPATLVARPSWLLSLDLSFTWTIRDRC